MKCDTFTWDSGDGDLAVEITVSRATLEMAATRETLAARASRYLRSKKNKYLAYLEAKAADRMADISSERVQADLERDDSLDGYALWRACSLMYPSCLATTVSIKNDKDAETKLSLQMSPDQFLQLPDGLAVEWYNAVLALNPHWNPFPRPQDDEEGEAPAPATDSGSTSKS